MKKGILFGTIAVVMVLGFITPTSAATTNLAWDCAVGDSLKLELNTSLNLGLPSTITNAIDAWLGDGTGNMNLSYTFADIMDIINTKILPKSVGIKAEITAIEAVDTTTDVISADILLNRNGGDYKVPAAFVNDTIDSLTEVAWEVMTANMDFGEATAEEIAQGKAQQIGMLKDMATAKIGTTAPVLDVAWSTVASAAAPAQGSPLEMLSLAAMPLGAQSMLILPQAWDWSALWTAAKAVADTQLTAMGLTLDTLMAGLGINKVVVEKRAIALSFSVADIDWESTALAPLFLMMAGYDLSYLETYGVSLTEFTVKFGIEWDSKGLLSAVGFYVTGAATLDLDTIISLIPTTLGGPSIPYTMPVELMALLTGSKDVSVSFGQKVNAPGVTAPTEDNIDQGKIGSARDDGKGGIPGYSVEFVSIIACLTVAGIILKKRHA